jgi:hypothetical protein
MENNRPLDEREPTPYPSDNQFKNISHVGPLNSVIVPPIKKALEVVNLGTNDKRKQRPMPIEERPMPIEERPMPIEERPMPIEEPKNSIVPDLIEAEKLLKERELTPFDEPKNSIVPHLIEAEKLSKERELTPFEMPTPFEENIAYDSVRPQKEIIIEEYIIKKPKMPLLEEESMTNSMELVPNVRRSRKSKSKSALSTTPIKTRKYKRCTNNHRRSKKTHRCNKNCPPGHKKSAISRRCIKKGGKKSCVKN